MTPQRLTHFSESRTSQCTGCDADDFASSYLGFYALIVIVCVLMNVVVVVFFTIAALRASRRLHYRLIESILGSTLRWLDVTPTARGMKFPVARQPMLTTVRSDHPLHAGHPF